MSTFHDAAEHIFPIFLTQISVSPSQKGKGSFLSKKCGSGLGLVEDGQAQSLGKEFAARLRQIGLTVVWDGSRTKETGWGETVTVSVIVKEDPKTVGAKISPDTEFLVPWKGHEYTCRWHPHHLRSGRATRHQRFLEVKVAGSWTRIGEWGNEPPAVEMLWWAPPAGGPPEQKEILAGQRPGYGFWATTAEEVVNLRALAAQEAVRQKRADMEGQLVVFRSNLENARERIHRLRELMSDPNPRDAGAIIGFRSSLQVALGNEAEWQRRITEVEKILCQQ